MNVTLLSRARRHFNSEYLSRDINRAHQRKWVRMIRYLGPKWLAVPSNDITNRSKEQQ